MSICLPSPSCELRSDLSLLHTAKGTRTARSCHSPPGGGWVHCPVCHQQPNKGSPRHQHSITHRNSLRCTATHCLVVITGTSQTTTTAKTPQGHSTSPPEHSETFHSNTTWMHFRSPNRRRQRFTWSCSKEQRPTDHSRYKHSFTLLHLTSQ